jgi:hypothetical protein
MIDEKSAKKIMMTAAENAKRYCNAQSKEEQKSEEWWIAKVHQSYWDGYLHAMEFVISGH